MNEIWFPVTNAEMINPRYQIVPDTYEFSNNYRIRNKKTGNILTIDQSNGDGTITLRCNYINYAGEVYSGSHIRAKFSVRNIIMGSLTGKNVYDKKFYDTEVNLAIQNAIKK